MQYSPTVGLDLLMLCCLLPPLWASYSLKLRLLSSSQRHVLTGALDYISRPRYSTHLPGVIISAHDNMRVAAPELA